MIPAVDSLLKYENPVLVSQKSLQDLPVKVSPQHPTGSSPVPPPPKPKCPIADANREKTEEILHAILPPREWTEGNKLWVQRVSSSPGTRMDVIKLQEQLDLKLQQRQARETGICPVRRELYSQCFDELIRQETISCAERGLLLLRVRDEIRMCMAAYQTLYESSVAFGIRKVLQSEEGKNNMEKQIQHLENEKRVLQLQVKELQAECEAIQLRERERRDVEEKKHMEEIEFLKRTNQQLKYQLAGITQKK
ncbi:33 kDa inner dynein arm light chain, axonemal-like [Megalops cyprinoides]|uniref:33 kDa inner dynein arm light chain, axonemal-like n=1 Tax=Megalops cyprinoides TaxID=118141 RepID=UPI001864751B|nr:33 kDa inner dynein arm light chain, axonemal-like [Megalops cyprinoides]